MATSKTLSPTGVSISIPAMADKPDQRVNSDCIDKEADAINALHDKISSYVKSKIIYAASGNQYKINMPGSGAFFMYATSSNINRCWSAIVITYSSGAAYVLELAKGTGVSFTAGTGFITIDTTSTGPATINVFAANASALTDVVIATS